MMLQNSGAPPRDIRNEDNPYMREIWALGYTEVVVNEMEDKVSLYMNQQLIKDISLMDLKMCIYGCNIVSAILIDGAHHRWIKEADGSADKFRELIKPY